MDNIYNHEEDGFDDLFNGPITANVSINLPTAETLSVNGPRQTPLIINISNKAERNPRRDAEMLATFLSCSLDDQTVFYLTELLFNKHMAPLVAETKEYLAAAMKESTVVTKPKSSLKKPSKKDEHQD
jgi:hypothetical protein